MNLFHLILVLLISPLLNLTAMGILLSMANLIILLLLKAKIILYLLGKFSMTLQLLLLL